MHAEFFAPLYVTKFMGDPEVRHTMLPLMYTVLNKIRSSSFNSFPIERTVGQMNGRTYK